MLDIDFDHVGPERALPYCPHCNEDMWTDEGSLYCPCNGWARTKDPLTIVAELVFALERDCIGEEPGTVRHAQAIRETHYWAHSILNATCTDCWHPWPTHDGAGCCAPCCQCTEPDPYILVRHPEILAGIQADLDQMEAEDPHLAQLGRQLEDAAEAHIGATQERDVALAAFQQYAHIKHKEAWLIEVGRIAGLTADRLAFYLGGVTDDPTDPRLGRGVDNEPLPSQHEVYLVLSEAERAKGFVRPYRDRYRHLTCGAVTTMGQALSETYARKPDFYGATFCVRCSMHRPVGEHGEFVWVEADGRDGPKVGT